MDKKSMKAVADKAVKGHEKRMHKMAKGSVTNEMLKSMGRNMARVANQRSTGRGR